MVEQSITKDTPDVWQVSLPEVDGSYELTGPWPVQAVGEFAGLSFYFRAAHDRWEFETENEVGQQFSSSDARAFRRTGKYTNASETPLHKAVALIGRCLAEFRGLRA
jgi:hypothetical protein